MNIRPPFPMDRRGFTLVETVIVVVLMGIVALIATPRISQFIRYNKVEHAVDRVIADIQLARMQAVRTGNRVNMTLSDPSTYTISEVRPTGTFVLKTARFDRDDVSLAATGTLGFNPRGLVVSTSTGWRVTVLKNGLTADITVTDIGRAYRVQ